MNCGKKINAKYEFSFLNYDFHLKKQVLPSEQIPPKIQSLSVPPRPFYKSIQNSKKKKKMLH